MNNKPRIAWITNRPAAATTDYDACTPDTLPAEQIAFVEAVHRKFLLAWAQDVSDYLQAPVAGEPGESQLTSFSQFLENWGGGGCIATSELAPGPGKMFVALGAGLVSRVLGLLLGAPGDPPAGRSTVTDIELNILREFVDRLIRGLQAAWSPFHVDIKYLEVRPSASVEPSGEEDRMLLLRSALRFAGEEEPFCVALPPLMARLAAVESRNDGRNRSLARDDLRAALGKASFEVEAVLTGSTVRMSDLLAMEPGLVVALGQPANAPLHCQINGMSKFRGELIQSRGRSALLIERPVNSQDEGPAAASRCPA